MTNSKGSPTKRFALGLLDRIDRNQREAQDELRRREAAKEVSRRRASKEFAAKERESRRKETEILLSRYQKSNSRSARQNLKQKSSHKPPYTSKKENKKLAQTTPEPLKPLPGMEFVVRRTKKRRLPVPPSSDYSDLFGDEYFAGIDLKYLKDLKGKSAKAQKETQSILNERREKADTLLKEAKEELQKSKELANMGKLDQRERNRKKRKRADEDWIAVETAEQALSQGKKPKCVIDSKQFHTPSVAERKAELKARIMRTLGGSASSPSRSKQYHSTSPKRKRASDEGGTGGKRFSTQPRRTENSLQGKYTRQARETIENSCETSDEEDLNGIEALDREERISTLYAKQEDRRERLLELRRQREKQRRREEFKI